MKKHIFSLFSILIFLFFLASCGGSTDNKNVDDSFSITGHGTVAEMIMEEDEIEIDMEKGKEIYQSKCMVCHQQTGLGIPGTYPPLADSDYLLADKKRAFMQIKNGSKEPITINGVEYPGGVMPPQELTDEEAIQVLNYIYNSWGNEGGKVSLEEVQ